MVVSILTETALIYTIMLWLCYYSAYMFKSLSYTISLSLYMASSI